MRRTLASLAAILITFAVAGEARAAATLMTGLGGLVGYGTNCIPPNDDGSWPADNIGLDITPSFPQGLHFYGGSHTRAWLNNNGNVSFQGALSTFTPNAFPGAPQPMIAPYWADVDTRDPLNTCNDGLHPSGGGYPPGATCANPPTNGVWWSLKPGQMVVTWDHVGFYSCHTTPTMSFQMILSSVGCALPNPDGGMAGLDFDIEFRYAQCGWEAGDASGGTAGFCPNMDSGFNFCTPAQAGFDSAEMPDMDYWSLPMSRMNGISTELCNNSNLMPAQPGIWRFSVRGGVIQCPNAGKPCTTGMPGICAQGQLQCNVQGGDGGMGGTTCVPITPARPSQCNGLDNNCDGMIDNGPCPVNYVCQGASCVPKCSEASCPPGQTCVADVCVETACIGVTCPAGKRCSAGMCVDDCSGVTCPLGQVCRLGSCVDPCLGLNCGTGQVCEKGMCVPECPCTMCAANQTCEMSGSLIGHCIETDCISKFCPPGNVCKMGNCVDACMGAVCPTGQMCMTGMCVPAPPMPVDAGTPLMMPEAGPIPEGGVDDGSAGDGGDDSGSGMPFGADRKTGGCSCRTTGPTGPRGLAIGLGLGLVGLLVGRRRRKSG
jgi:MYXO-CTERM domain-containing protein